MNDFRIFAILFLFLNASVSSAQFSAGAKIDLVSNDVTASSGSLDLGNLIQSKSGYKIGAVVAYDLTDRFSVESGLNYNALGFQITQSTGIDILGLSIPLGATLDTRVSYIEIPMLANYKFDFGYIQGYIEAGPSINYATSGRIKTIANSILDFNILERNIDFQSNRFNRTNLSGNVGFGISNSIADDMELSAGIKFTRDFTGSVEVPIVDARIKNQSVGVGMKLMKRF